MKSSFTCRNCGKPLYSLIEIIRDGDNIYCEICAHNPPRDAKVAEKETCQINETTDTSQKLILLAEDDWHVKKLLGEVINEYFDKKVKVASFDDGNPSSNFFKENLDKVSVVISCIIMPEMDGIKLLRMCKELNPNIPFIILSALEPRGEMTVSNADAYIVKHSDFSELLNTVRKFLNI